MKALVYLLFLLSGACGLIYEVVWSRMLTEVFGGTVIAVGTILAAFMSGLALGGYFLGKWGDHSRYPLRLYALYEIGIGVTALISTLLIGRVSSAYVWLFGLFGGSAILLSGARFLMAFGLVLVPTLLMGATLPILARFFIANLSAVGQSLSSLYALNTAGAVAGSLLAGFVLIGRIGIHRSVMVAVVCNVAIGLVAWFASKWFAGPVKVPHEDRADEPATGGPSSTQASNPDCRLLLWAFALSGLASFAYEIFWTRSLVHLLGNSTYAFTMMLTAFLSGLALGGFLVRFLLKHLSHGIKWFAVLQILIGASAAVAMPLLFTIVHSGAFQEFLAEMSGRFGPLIFSQFAVGMVVMLIPATLIGATFPLAGSILVKDLQQAGASVGRIYAANTLGNVVGALAPAFILLPVYGIQRGILLMSALNVTLGLFILASHSKRFALLRFVAPIVFVLAAGVLPRLSFGFQFPSGLQEPDDRVLYYREGLGGTTKVFQEKDTGAKRMSIDGIVIGGTEYTDYKQQVLAHLPKLLVEDYSSELSIGLGSGILIGESLRHDQLERLVCLEIEPTVMEGAKYFARENHEVLSDPRLEVVIDDAGNFLRTSDEKFDIVSADEKTADKYASNGFSYSRDYYLLLNQHLNPGGVVIQWIPTHLPLSQYMMVLKTIASVFPHTTIWYFPGVGKLGPTSTFVTASLEPLVFDVDWMNGEMRSRGEEFNGWRKYGIETAEALLAHYVADEAIVIESTRLARENSLEFPYYEFYSPREYATPMNERTLRVHDFLQSLRPARGAIEIGKLLAVESTPKLRDAIAAEDEFLKGFRVQVQSGPYEEISRHYETALETASWNRNLRCQILSYLWTVGGNLYIEGRYQDALFFLGQAAEVFPSNGEVRFNYGLALLQNGRLDEAAEEMQESIRLNPRLIAPRRHLASIFFDTEAYSEAARQVDAILAIEPEDQFALQVRAALSDSQ